MQVIHFTAGATDPFDDFDALGIRYIPLASGERESDEQAIVITVESPRLKATARGLSTPHRVSNQYWPGEHPPRRTPMAACRIRYYRAKWWRRFVLRRLRARLARSRLHWLRSGLGSD